MPQFSTGLFRLDPTDQGRNLARELTVIASDWDKLTPFLKVSAAQRAADVIWASAGGRAPRVRAAKRAELGQLRARGVASLPGDVYKAPGLLLDVDRSREDVLTSLVETAAYASLPLNDRTFLNRGVCRDLADAWMRGYDAEAEVPEVPGTRISDPERAL